MGLFDIFGGKPKGLREQLAQFETAVDTAAIVGGGALGIPPPVVSLLRAPDRAALHTAFDLFAGARPRTAADTARAERGAKETKSTLNEIAALKAAVDAATAAPKK